MVKHIYFLGHPVEHTVAPVLMQAAGDSLGLEPPNTAPWRGQVRSRRTSSRRGKMAFDAIYKPIETPFLKMAREAGARILNGLL